MVTSTGLEVYLTDLRRLIDDALEQRLLDLDAPAPLAGALRYALIAPGKRLRPCLTLAVAEATGAASGLDTATAHALALPAACAVEMIHSYSLVHDDLPAMDDDDLRRGRPTSHIVHGEGLAILAGDGLATDAFAVLTGAVAGGDRDAPRPTADQLVRAVRTLALAAGSRGMVGGQAIDLAASGQVEPPAANALTSGAALEDMHLRKTGALIRAACALGAIVTGATDDLIAAVDAYGRELGLAFQIVDDVLDVEGASAVIGKTAGKDAAAGKPTFAALYGLDDSKARARACIDRAVGVLDAHALGGRLRDIAEWSLRRNA